MNRNVFLLIIIFAVIWSCNSNDKSESNLPYRILESSKIIEDTSYYSINIDYPIFLGNDEGIENAFGLLNNSISGFLDTAARYYWGSEIDSVRLFKDETKAAGKYLLNNQYQILDTTPDIISLKMETYSYALGAHGFTAIRTYTFDVNTKKLLKISDLLDLSDPQNVKLLNSLLAEYFINPENCFNQNPTADASFELIGLEGENMLFYYEAYELGAFYCGSAEVKVPIEALKKAGLWKFNKSS